MLDQLAAFFQTLGVHPLLAGFALGFLFGWLLTRRPKPNTDTGQALRMAAKAERISTRVAAIAVNHQALGISDEVAEEILRLVRSDQKIEAIKRLREVTGLGLKEAKDAVDAMSGE